MLAKQNMKKEEGFDYKQEESDVFGRVSGLDLFDANFLNGEKVKLRWEE